MTPAPDAHQLDLHARLAAALEDDPFVLLDVDAGALERIAAVPGEAVAWLSNHPSRGVRWVTGLAADPASAADVAAAVRLVVRLATEARDSGHGPAGVTVSRGGRPLLPPDLQAPEAWEWDFWVTREEPGPEAMVSAYGPAARVVDVPAADPRLAPLLDLASPSAPLRPGDPRVVRWAAIEDPDHGLSDTGGLAAVLAVTVQRSGAAHLNDVATHPERRGRGLARTLCGQVTLDALRAGHPAVTLGMYADNDPARRVYSALGFTFVRGQTSGPL
ncbi:MAG TPA: GNAT family N-acetyltransferase [Candidatus Angelobacter sp.]|nr:GNAT family N-acetyltransferase [Candidatus Angelobacter sp.]